MSVIQACRIEVGTVVLFVTSESGTGTFGGLVPIRLFFLLDVFAACSLLPKTAIRTKVISRLLLQPSQLLGCTLPVLRHSNK
jgi:hypothetical protein